MYSNFISPPDFVSGNENHRVLIIDAEKETIADLALICKSAGSDFDIYVYDTDMDDLGWLQEAFNRSNVAMINTKPTALSPIKDRLTEHPKSYYYGPKNFLNQLKKIDAPQQYFVAYLQHQQQNGFNLGK
jgi:chlorite dismutase